VDVGLCRAKYKALAPTLTERARRIWAATEARAAGWGGITGVARATGIASSTIQRGLQELNAKRPLTAGRIRRPGGGRKKTLDKDPTLLADLEGLVEPTASGDPMAPLRWTSKSVRHLAASLQRMGHQVSRQLVAELLAAAGYSLQANRKTREGASHPDRDAQFRYINQQVRRFQAATQPVISVDTKKKELVGDFKNAGRQRRPKGHPEPVRVHDFLIPARGKAIPYGVYDLTRDAGWVSVGIDHDTASFAVESIRRWWNRMGKKRYPKAKELTITADCGGSNGNRNKLWKVELQKLADESKMILHVRHFPPGTSKWNKIEHRLFSFISRNWRGKPLLTLAMVVNLIAHTKTQTGLTVKAMLDKNKYKTGTKVSDAEMASLNLTGESFHPEWNYRIAPRGG